MTRAPRRTRQGKRPNVALRIIAHFLMARCLGDASQAARFLIFVAGKTAVADPRKFCKRWGDAELDSDGIPVEGPRPGRQRKIVGYTDKQIEHWIRESITVGDHTRRAQNAREACMFNPNLRKILQDNPGATHQDVWRAAKRHNPALTTIRTTFKRKLTQKDKVARIAFAEHWLNCDLRDLMRMVFIDEARIGLSPNVPRVIGVPGEEIIITDKRAGRSTDPDGPLDYILAVNYFVGIVHLSIVSNKKNPKRGQTIYRTKSGDIAKSLTLAEFKARFAAIKRATIAHFKERFGVDGPEPLYVWDNGRFHPKTAAEVNLKEGQYVEIPPYSPDINKAVEHMHKSVKLAFHTLWDAYEHLSKRDDGAEVLAKVWKEMEVKESVQKDVMSLKETFQAIIDAKGGHIPRKFR